MTDLGPATYDAHSTDALEFKRFDDLVLWLWGDEALQLDFIELPTGAGIPARIKLKSFAGADRFPQLRGLHLGDVRLSNLKGIEAFEALESLSIHGNTIRKLDPLTALSSLRYLDLAMVGASDLSPVAELPQLEWLLLHMSPVKDLSPLAACPQLGVLRLDFCTKFRDIGPLGEIGLRHLDLNLCDLKKADFSAFSSLRYLKPNQHRKVHEAAAVLGPDVVHTDPVHGDLAEVLSTQAWYEPGREQDLVACSMGLHNQRVNGAGDLTPFTNLRELRVPAMDADLTTLTALRRVEAAYSGGVKLPSGARFGSAVNPSTPTGLWVNHAKPETYDAALYPELKWWIDYYGMWRLSRA